MQDHHDQPDSAEQVMNSPHTSYWLRQALEKAMKRDPLDALHDAQELVAVLSANVLTQLSQHGPFDSGLVASLLQRHAHAIEKLDSGPLGRLNAQQVAILHRDLGRVVITLNEAARELIAYSGHSDR